MQIIKIKEKGVVYDKVLPYEEYMKKNEKKGKQAKIVAKGVEYKPTVVKNSEIFPLSKEEKKKKREITNFIYHSTALKVE